MILDALLKNWPAFTLILAVAVIASLLKGQRRRKPGTRYTTPTAAQPSAKWQPSNGFSNTTTQDAPDRLEELLRRPQAISGTTQQTRDTSRWSLELLRALEWKRFEVVCAAYFEAIGFTTRVARAGADGGIDIHLCEKGSTTPGIIVQCKAWNTYKVGIKPIRELYGVMAQEGVAEGIFVTTGRFTDEARGFPKSDQLHLWDGEYFLEKLNELPHEAQESILRTATDGDFATPSCPSCATKMVERKTKEDSEVFWGCRNFPRCRQTFKKAA